MTNVYENLLAKIVNGKSQRVRIIFDRTSPTSILSLKKVRWDILYEAASAAKPPPSKIWFENYTWLRFSMIRGFASETACYFAICLHPNKCVYNILFPASFSHFHLKQLNPHHLEYDARLTLGFVYSMIRNFASETICYCAICVAHK